MVTKVKRVLDCLLVLRCATCGVVLRSEESHPMRAAVVRHAWHDGASLLLSPRLDVVLAEHAMLALITGDEESGLPRLADRLRSLQRAHADAVCPICEVDNA